MLKEHKENARNEKNMKVDRYVCTSVLTFVLYASLRDASSVLPYLMLWQTTKRITTAARTRLDFSRLCFRSEN